MNVTKKQIAAAYTMSAVKPTDIKIIASVTFNQSYNPYKDSVQVDTIPIDIILVDIKYIGIEIVVMDIHGKAHFTTGYTTEHDGLKVFSATVAKIVLETDKYLTAKPSNNVMGLDLSRTPNRASESIKLPIE